MAEFQFRPATEKDVPAILRLMQMLAGTGSRDPDDRVKIGKEDLLKDGFGEECFFKVLLMERVPANDGDAPADAILATPPPPTEDNQDVIGYALYFFTYSWSGRALFLEDLYIRDEYRGKGHGTALMKEVAMIAKEKDCGRMTWQVFNWNTGAYKLYERVGGKCAQNLLTFHMDKQTLHEFTNS